MSNRYLVRTVNLNAPDEHFVVSDFRHDGACVNVYFNRFAALEEARWLNRQHHCQQLRAAKLRGYRDHPVLMTCPPAIEPVDSANENLVSSDQGRFSTHPMADHQTTDLQAEQTQEHQKDMSQRLVAQAVKDLMTRRWVK